MVQLRRAAYLASLAAALAPSGLMAGTFTRSPYTGDADSGINSGLTYTSAADFNGTGSQTINGVPFSNTGLSGTNYSLTMTAAGFTGFGNALTGDSNGAISNFYYTGDGSGNASMTLTGLTPGQTYVTTWYAAGFGGAGGRNVNITPSDTGSPFLFDENFTGGGNGNLLRYTFTATGTSITYAFDAVSNGDSFHHYAMTNSVVNTGLLTTANVNSTTNGGGFFAPYSPSSADLLQTSLASVSSSGNFAQENTGGVQILNNGQFSITGVGNNNPELATVENGSLITFNLDTATSPQGYNITGVDTYGGWNDSGRDRQSFKLSYSLVGSSDFTYIGSVDHDPAAAGNPSAVFASFPMSLTGVDAVRIEFFGNQENGYAGLGEIDVFGTPVPEPSASVLVGILGLACFRRRR